MPDAPPLSSAARIGLAVELRMIRNESRDWPAHWHADLQLIATRDGRGTAWVGGKAFDLPGGALIVIPPGAVHTAREASAGAGWSFLSLHIDPVLLHEAVPPEGWSAFIALRGSRIAGAFEDLVTTLFERKSVDPGPAWQTLLRALRSTAPPASEPPLAPRLRLARETLASAFNPPGSVDAVAAAAGYKRRSFERAFKLAYALSPHAWRLIARIELSKRALRSGRTVADAARQAGYADLRHFSRQYRQLTGITARAYSARFRGDGALR